MKYGELPKSLGTHIVDCNEMMFYQYLPIKMSGETKPIYEQRLRCFDDLIGVILCDFVGVFGLDRYVNSYVYLTAKRLYQAQNCSFNRTGWHSDGFMTDDINYIWSDCFPTIFNKSNFDLTMNDLDSMKDMENQAMTSNNVVYSDNELLRLDQFNIHRVSEIAEPKMRTFVKVSISKDKYDLIGNSHNYLIDYKWEMRERSNQRNIPQKIK